MSKRSSIFNTIRTEGAILPAELLQRIVNGDATLEGLKSTDYHLSPSERLNEAATRSWNRLIGVWQTYREILNQLPEESIGTTETRERWLLPLFQELGYGRLQTQKSIEIEDKTYPISHKASEPVAIHLISFKYDLDRRPHLPLTTHHLPKSSPHSLMQEFLNRSEDHLWGILSNGLKLRILRDNVSLTRVAYVEFDLQAMMDGIAYSDFFLLYLLCHQSRVEVKTDETGKVLPPESCWLEKWYNASIKDGVRALDELRNNVQSAIESLGAGFLSHPGNTDLRDKLRSGTLTLQEYYHQVLLQVYRLLFVFVAEDRDLLIPNDEPDTTSVIPAKEAGIQSIKQIYLKYYSTYRIRELARKKRGTRHCDLWQQLVLLYQGLYEGNAALGLPALGSFLFSKRDRTSTSPSGHLATSPSTISPILHLDNCKLSNADLLSAVRFLCYTQKNNIFQPINYRNLGPEELGSVYESLLEMHPEINLEAGYFKLNVVSGSQRKTTGSYYTPSSLVNCLLDSALEPVIANAVSGEGVSGRVVSSEGVSSKWNIESSEANPHLPLTTDHSPNPTSPSTISPSGHLATSPETSLLALKICDPACGSGHFLIAAAHRIAKRLATIRAGEDEPAPSVIHHALRDVIGHCIYGVDINPMSVELCKISLWMEALEPGKPLTFLDHHIQCGNSLLGCTPALLQKGIPDAAFTPLTGDDKGICSVFRKQNKATLGQAEITSYNSDFTYDLEKAYKQGKSIESMPDENLEQLEKKSLAYSDYLSSEYYWQNRLPYDAWCAAFVWVKHPDNPSPITNSTLENLLTHPDNIEPERLAVIKCLADEYQFFHWHIAFPDVFIPDSTSPSGHLATSPTSGFDCILGNPPWERVKLQEKEFFAARDESIAKALNASARKKMIEDLPKTNPALYEQFLSEKRKSEGSSEIIREGGLFPLCGRGDLNTYTVFAELNRILLSPNGNCGCIVPSGIATDDTTKFFFQDLFDTGSLKSLYDFENRENIFPAVDSRMKFCLLTMRSTTYHLLLTTHQSADFVFFAHSIADLSDSERHFKLSKEDIALINPNTRTCPIFRSKQDAELTKYIYRRVPVLINENDPEHGNPWGIKFSTMFHMSNDSHLFKTKVQLEEQGFELQGNHFVPVVQDSNPAENVATPSWCFTDGDSALPNKEYLPLYEAKMIHHYNHRFGDYADLPEGSDSTQLPEVPLSKLQDPDYEPLPRYWVSKSVVDENAPNKKGYWLGFRDITNITNERTVITDFIPYSAVSNKLPLLLNDKPALVNNFLIVCLNSLACDFVSRFKIGATSLNYFIAKQLAVLPPSVFEKLDSLLTTYRLPLTPNSPLTTYHSPLTSPAPLTTSLSRHLTNSLLELLYTSYSLQPFAKDCGYDGPPFIWDEERRFEIRCELDALYFHLYLGTLAEWDTAHHLPLTTYLKTPRHAVEYIMETFPIVKRKDEKEYGEYRTKLRILEIYDHIAPLFESTQSIAYAATTSPSGHLAISPLFPPPGPPCDAEGNFIPVDKWDKNNWPKHIHMY